MKKLSAQLAKSPTQRDKRGGVISLRNTLFEIRRFRQTFSSENCALQPAGASPRFSPRAIGARFCGVFEKSPNHGRDKMLGREPKAAVDRAISPVWIQRANCRGQRSIANNGYDDTVTLKGRNVVPEIYWPTVQPPDVLLRSHRRELRFLGRKMVHRYKVNF